MKFNIEDYKGEYVMHCKTEEEAIDFCNYLHSIGRQWRTGSSYKEKTLYGIHKNDTVYGFNEGSFCDIEYYRRLGYKVLEWSDFMGEANEGGI